MKKKKAIQEVLLQKNCSNYKQTVSWVAREGGSLSSSPLYSLQMLAVMHGILRNRS